MKFKKFALTPLVRGAESIFFIFTVLSIIANRCTVCRSFKGKTSISWCYYKNFAMTFFEFCNYKLYRLNFSLCRLQLFILTMFSMICLYSRAVLFLIRNFNFLSGVANSFTFQIFLQEYIRSTKLKNKTLCSKNLSNMAIGY